MRFESDGRIYAALPLLCLFSPPAAQILLD
jgi:hypothetical protein